LAIATDRPELAANLSKARREAGLTQKQAAQRLGLTDVTVSNHERGTTAPDNAIVESYAALYGWTPAQLRYGRAESNGSAPRPPAALAELPRQLERLALQFEQEMLEAEVDDEFRRYARRRLRDPELLEMYAGGHVERAMTAEEQLDDYEDLIDELRGRLKRRLVILKKGGAAE
jgi:transcriptional regulator with XRE-family HTH domain